MSISDKIKKLRQEKRFKQESLAEKIGVSRLMLGKYERGEATPSAETLQKLAQVLEVSIDYLLSGDEKSEVSPNFGDKTLQKYFEEIDKMNDEERGHVKFILDAVVKNRDN
jgi:Predicted transcription factor, homolog of eukaryotic MBF1